VDESYRLIQVRFNDVAFAETRPAHSGDQSPPDYCFPPADVRMAFLHLVNGRASRGTLDV
jgi:uncharacterized protein (DUF427 family)